MTSPAEELKSKLKIDPQEEGPRIPVTKFEGTLKEYRVEVVPAEEGKRAKDGLKVAFDFTDCTIIETKEPYPFPTVPIEVGYSDRAETRWMELMGTFKSVVPAEARVGFDNPLDVLVGKRQTWEWGVAKLRRPLTDEDRNPVLDDKGKQKWGVVDGGNWCIVAVEGFGGAGAGRPSFTDLLVEFAKGKDDKAVGQWLFTDSTPKAYGAEYNKAVEHFTDGKQNMKALVAAGLLSVDPDTGLYK